MDLQDVRRLSFTSMLLAGLLLVWLFLLFLHQEGLFEWDASGRALRAMSFLGWMWTGAVLLGVFLGVVGFTTFGVHQGPRATPRSSVRQVQCQDCKAVFFIPDNGKRPLTHLCPNCKALGVYDGESAPVGTPPKPRPPREIIELGLTCRTCSHRFMATDTGVRPMRVTCPKCQAVGEVF